MASMLNDGIQLSDDEIATIELTFTISNYTSLSISVFGLITCLISKPKHFPGNIPFLLMIFAVPFHLTLLISDFVGFAEIRKEEMFCNIQAALFIFLVQVVLNLQIVMNYNIYSIIVLKQEDEIERNRTKWLIAIFGTPLLCSILGLPAYGEEVTFCWVPLEEDWWWQLISHILLVIVSMFGGFYWWGAIISNIYIIFAAKHRSGAEARLSSPYSSYSSYSSSASTSSVAIEYAVQYWRQLLWIVLNIFVSSLLTGGFLAFSVFGQLSKYPFQIMLNVTFGTVGAVCFVCLIATKDSAIAWRVFLTAVYIKTFGTVYQLYYGSSMYVSDEVLPSTHADNSDSIAPASADSSRYNQEAYNSAAQKAAMHDASRVVDAHRDYYSAIN